jgi:hypothetical protein
VKVGKGGVPRVRLWRERAVDFALMGTMKPRLTILSGSLVLACLAAPAWGQSGVDTSNKFAWSENTGWLNFRDAGEPAGQQGVRLEAGVLAGFAWGENIGWINFGDGTPGTVLGYGNATGSDFGVNIDSATGNLAGLAWGENVGWINFGWAAGAVPANPQRPRIELGRFRGFAWGENIGWINLDLAAAGQFVGIDLGATCLADIAGGGADGLSPDGTIDGTDFIAFINSFGIGDATVDPLADVAGAGDDGLQPDGTIDGSDFIAFINAFAAGC